MLREIKKDIVRMAHYSHASHIGSALSVVDLLYVIYTRVVNISKNNVDEIDRDKVILSKGHASIALYAVLAELGLIDKNKLNHYYIDGGDLPGHLDKDSVIGIDCSAGSLGHGLPIGIGMALSNPGKKVIVLMGDGETEEGSVWESIIFLGKHPLPNLTVIVDSNNLQGFDVVDKVAEYSKLCNTLDNFGLDCVEIDGHNLGQIEQALKRNISKTNAIIARTIKGKGVSYMENKLEWHYKSPNDEELKVALNELDR